MIQPSATSPDQFDQIGRYYDRLVDQFGHHPRACDYGRAESQLAKFRVLEEIIEPGDDSLLDVGCGFADFADHLEARQIEISYHGIDLSAEMIKQARGRRPDLTLDQQNLLELQGENEFDVVTANGIFYLLGQDAQRLVPLMMQTMFRLARRAVAVNSLSNWATDQEPNEFYADPLETLLLCRKLTSRVTLRHDYHPRDFTIYLYK